jgi:hypothetical protein
LIIDGTDEDFPKRTVLDIIFIENSLILVPTSAIQIVMLSENTFLGIDYNGHQECRNEQ